MSSRKTPVVILALAAVPLGGCNSDPPPRSAPVIDRLTAPDDLAGLPRVDNARDLLRTIVDQPPGLAFVINGYGTAVAPPLTLEAYYGNPAGIAVVQRVLTSRFDDASSPERQCGSSPQQGVTCWRSADTLVVAVSVRGGRDADDARAAVAEAWQEITH
jgi:hypothetical protein